MIEDIQRAMNIDFQSCCDALCLRLLLIAQDIVEVFENGHFLRSGIGKVVLIDHADAPVNDGLLNRLQAIFASDNQLTHGEDEVGFQRQWVFLFGIVHIDVQRIDVVGADRRNADHLTAELLHKGVILGLWVTHDDVILGNQKSIGHFPLCREGFTTTGSTENQPVGVFELLSVHHDHVVGQCVQAVIQSLTALKKLLRRERNENRRAGCGQSALNFDLVQADGKRGHKTFFLLEVQTLERTVIFLRDGCRLEDGIFELLTGRRGIHDEDGHEEHSLVSRLEILQQTLGLASVGGKVGGDDVHIVAGTDSFLLFLNLHLVQIGNLGLDALDGLSLINGADMKIDSNVGVHIEEVSQHTVIQLRRENLQKAHRADGSAHLETLAFPKVERGRRDEVFAAETGTGNHIEGEAEWFAGVHIEHIMQDFQPLIAGQRLGLHTEGFEVVEDVCLHPVELGLGGTQRVSLNAEGDVLALDEAVIAFCELGLQHIRILGADVIESIVLFGDADRLLELIDVHPLIDEGELHENGAVEVVEEVTPVFKDGGLILVLGKLIVDVVVADGLGVEPVIHLADTVLAHLHIRNGLLGGLGDFLCLLVLFLLHDDLLLFRSGKSVTVHTTVFHGFLRRFCLFGAVCQSAIPPVP